MAPEPVWERADVEAILGGIFDANAHLAAIARALEEDDGEEEEDEGRDHS